MSTHATIAIFNNATQTVRSVYLHSDGYRSFAGRMLLEHFTTEEKVNALIDLGDLSRIAPSIAKPLGHTFENPVNGYTVAYTRDRNEPGADNKAQVQSYKNFRYNSEGYTYLFVNGRWTTVSPAGPKFLALTTTEQTEMNDEYFINPYA